MGFCNVDEGASREVSSSEMEGGRVSKTLLGLRESMEERTAEIWRDIMVGLYRFGGRVSFELVCNSNSGEEAGFECMTDIAGTLECGGQAVRI